MRRREMEFDKNQATPLVKRSRHSVRNRAGRCRSWIHFYDEEGVFVHKIKVAFYADGEPGFNGKWHHSNAYVYNNRIWLIKHNTRERRVVSYPIPRCSRYYNIRKKTLMTERYERT